MRFIQALAYLFSTILVAALTVASLLTVGTALVVVSMTWPAVFTAVQAGLATAGIGGAVTLLASGAAVGATLVVAFIGASITIVLWAARTVAQFAAQRAADYMTRPRHVASPQPAQRAEASAQAPRPQNRRVTIHEELVDDPSVATIHS